MTQPHRIFMTWTVSRRNLDDARRLYWKLSQQGNLVTGCSLDRYVPDWDDCPVCGNRGQSTLRLPWEIQLPRQPITRRFTPFAYGKRRKIR